MDSIVARQVAREVLNYKGVMLDVLGTECRLGVVSKGVFLWNDQDQCPRSLGSWQNR